MAGVSVTEVWGSRVTSSIPLWLSQVPLDQYFSGNLLLGILTGQQSRSNKKRFALRGDRVRRMDGSRLIRLPVSYGPATGVTSFSQADELPLTIDDTVTMAQAPWSYYTGDITMTYQEWVENQGAARRFDLLQYRTNLVMDTLKNTIDGHIGSTGDGVSVGNSGKNLIGLQCLLSSDPATGTVWNLDRATYTWWRHNKITASDTFANVGLAKLAHTRVTQSGTNAEDPPTLWLTTSAQWEAYHAQVVSVQSINTVQVTGVADRAFPSLQYAGSDVFFDGSVPSNVWYGMNMNYFVFILPRGPVFDVEPFGKGSGKQMLRGIWRVIFRGQFGCERFDRQSYLVYTG